MENKIKAKKVGEVNIFEICGNLTGAFAERGKEAIQRSLWGKKHKNILFNLRELQEIDPAGIDALLTNAQAAQKSAMLCQERPFVQLIQQKDLNQKLPFLQNELEATRFFSREFAAPSLEEQIYPERRQFIRLKTALPIYLWYEMEENKRHDAGT